MPWLLLGIYAANEREPGSAALAGSLLHGVVFTNLAHTTLLALALNVPIYEALRQRPTSH